MASGTINLTQDGTLQGYISWTSSSNGSSANTSNVTAKLYVRKDPTTTTEPTYGTWPFTLTINGSTYGATSWYGSVGQSYTQIASYTLKNIAHGNDGTKSIVISASSSGPSGTSMSSYTASGSATVTLDTIPRYAELYVSNTSKTETTVTMKWTANAKVSYVWYSTDGGESFTRVTTDANAKTGTITISDLSAYTTYSVVVRVKRKDSGLNTTADAISVKTYNYPYCKTMPNFTIGNGATLEFYNPLGRTFTFYTICNGTEIDATVTTSAKSFSAYNASSSQSQLYATMPNVTSASYSIRVVYGSSSITKSGGTVSIDTSANKPTVGTVSYVDTNSATTAVTGDQAIVIQSKSTVTFRLQAPAAQSSATISSVTVTVNGTTHTMSLTQPVALRMYTKTGVTIDSATNVTAKFTVTDSRGLSASKTLTVTMLPWTAPTAIIDLHRQNNYYSTTYITVDAEYSSLSRTEGENNNTITISYEIGKKGSSTVLASGTLSDNVQSTFEANNLYNWWVNVYVTDLFETTPYTLSLPKGTPIVFYDVDKSSVGVNRFPTNDDSLEALDIYMNGYRIMGYVKTLTTENLNTILTQGIYYQNLNANAQTSLNYPISYAGYLEVLCSGGIAIQRYTAYTRASGDYKPVIYYRSYLSGTWSAWAKIHSTFDFEYKTKTVSGTTSSNGNISLGLTSSATVLNVVDTSGGYECGYYRTTTGNYYATVRAYGSGSKMASTSVSLIVTYFE